MSILIMSSKVNRKGTIIKFGVEEAVKTLIDKNYGLHLMLVYPSLEVLRQFYSLYTQKEVVENNGMVVIAPFYETTDSVRFTLSKTLKSVDVAKYESDNTITLLDANRFYSTNQASIDFMDTMVHYAKKMEKKGVTLMGDMGAFYFKGNSKNLVDYEISSLPKEFSLDRKGFCLYNQKDLEALSNNQVLELYEKHGIVIQLMVDL